MDTGNKTQFDEVYEVFLASIDSYDLAKLDDDELSDTLKSYLLSGVEVLTHTSIKSLQITTPKTVALILSLIGVKLIF